ncbi:MAG: hypothetical protein ACLGIJ_11615 [Candidatus Limnocylindria bacterium]
MADRTVYFAKITRGPQVGLFDRSLLGDIVTAIDPHKQVTRYNKTWRFSRPATLEDRFVLGKLGFVRTAPAAETTYDEEREDFVTTVGVANEGSFSMFVIDGEREILSFEERPPDINQQAFLGAFRRLLEEAGFPATVELLTDPRDYAQWVATVDRVVRVRAVVYNPNPGWSEDAGALREVVEQAEAERAEVVAVAPDDGSLNARAPWIEGALDQIAEHGQGQLSAIGVEGELRVRWKTGQVVRTATIRDEDADSPEGVWGWLANKIRDFYGR